MPGRPKTIAREITEVEDVVLHLAMRMFARIPSQYREKPNPADELNAAWNEAVRATLLASAKLEALGDLLRARAGITEPSPAAIVRAEWEARAKAGDGGGSGAASQCEPGPRSRPKRGSPFPPGALKQAVESLLPMPNGPSGSA